MTTLYPVRSTITPDGHDVTARYSAGSRLWLTTCSCGWWAMPCHTTEEADAVGELHYEHVADNPVDSSNVTMGAGIPDVDLDRLIDATSPVAPRDCDLMAPVPLPDGAESATPWKLTPEGRPYRVTNTGVVQYANGTTVDHVSEGAGTLPAMTTAPRPDLVDVGPATPPPAWCLPDATPEWITRIVEGVSPFHAPQVCFWGRELDGACITGEDEVVGGRVLRAQPRILLTGAPLDGRMTATQARSLAVLGSQVGDSRLIGGCPPMAEWRR